MTREQAEAMVEELLQSQHDYENAGWGARYIRDDFEKTKAKVINALCASNEQLTE